MQTRWTAMSAAGVVVAAVLAAPWGPVRADEPPAAELFYQGWYAETSERDPEKAIKLYQQVAARFAQEEAVAAKAQVQLAGCYEKLGRLKEAEAAWRVVLERFGARRDLVAKAEARLAALAGEGKGAAPAAGTAAPAAEGLPRLIADLGSADAGVSDAAYVALVDRDARDGLVRQAHAAGASADAQDPKDAGIAAAPPFAPVLRPLDGEAQKRARALLAALENGLSDAATARVWLATGKQTVSLDFRDAALEDVIEFLREFSQVNLVIDSRRVDVTKSPVTCRLTNATLLSALKLVAAMQDGVPVFHEGAIVITTAAGQAELARRAAERAEARRRGSEPADGAAAATTGLAAKLAALKVSVNFRETPLDDVISFLREMATLDLAVKRNGAAGDFLQRKVSVRVTNLALGHVLALLGDLYGFSVRAQDGVLVLEGRGA